VAYATVEDVGVRWGRTPSEEEHLNIDVRLADVERMIRKKIPDLDDRVFDGTIDVEDVKRVEADAVLRLIRNPDGFVSETDGNYTYQFSQGTKAGMLEILPEEWLLLGYTGSGRMFTLVPQFAPGE
jgi:hypothetical protein